MENSFYKVDTQEGVTILTLTWENIAWRENEELKKVVSKFLDEGMKDIVLDLSNISFISSIVLASLVYTLKRAKEGNGNLVLCGLQDKVKKVLVITNLDKIFDIVADKETAISRFKKK